MEDVLETYEQLYDPQQPVLCLDDSRSRGVPTFVAPLRLSRAEKRGGITNTNAAAQPTFSAR
jgi:hypothetical protein